MMLSGVAGEEKNAVWLLSCAVSDLGGYVNDYAQALALLIESTQVMEGIIKKGRELPLSEEEQNVAKGLRARCGIANRDSIMTVYHFGICLEGINKTLGSCPAARRTLDGAEMKAARKLYENKFPRPEANRHAVGHRADPTKTLKKQGEHSLDKNTTAIPGVELKGKVSGVTFRDSIMGGSYVNTWEKDVRKTTLDRSSLEALIESYHHVVRAFIPVEAELKRLAQLKGYAVQPAPSGQQP